MLFVSGKLLQMIFSCQCLSPHQIPQSAAGSREEEPPNRRDSGMRYRGLLFCEGGLLPSCEAMEEGNLLWKERRITFWRNYEVARDGMKGSPLLPLLVFFLFSSCASPSCTLLFSGEITEVAREGMKGFRSCLSWGSFFFTRVYLRRVPF